MKKIEHYVCEYCGTDYAEEDAALKCEAYHIKPIRIEKKSIQNNFWTPYNEKRQSEILRYPLKLNIEFDDGTVWTYEKAKSYSEKKKQSPKTSAKRTRKKESEEK